VERPRVSADAEGSVMLLVELLNKDIRQGFVAYFESLWGMGKKVSV